MSWEATISCDGCSTVVGGGSHSDCLDVLKGEAGRAFMVGRKRGTWIELVDARDWLHSSKRHLCGRCAIDPQQTKFFDGTDIHAHSTPEER